MPLQTMKQICDHLNFLGYEITKENKLTIAKHHRKMALFIEESLEIVMIASIFTSGEMAKSDKVGYLEFINSLNRDAFLTRVYIGMATNLIFEASFQGIYDKTTFGRFLEILDRDTRGQLNNKFTEASKYLM
jgi:hypothetical protein